MKRDLDLVRKILIAMEKSDQGFNRADLGVGDDISDEVIGHHVWLMGMADLIVCIESTDLYSTAATAVPLHITWQGHEFLAAARSDGRWARAKKIAKSAGEVPAEVMKAVLVEMAKKAVGLN